MVSLYVHGIDWQKHVGFIDSSILQPVKEEFNKKRCEKIFNEGDLALIDLP